MFNLVVESFSSDSGLDAVIMNRPRRVFAALQQRANEISEITEGPLTT